MYLQMSHGFTPELQSWIFATEGGYVDHPKDPGGATNMGITRKTLAAWRGISPYTALPKEEVRKLPKSEAAAIYKKNYWDLAQCTSLPRGVDYAVMDYAVNSGVSRAVKDLQRTVSEFYKGVVDGLAGTLTATAVKDYCEAYGVDSLIEAYCERRYNFVKGLSTFKTFGKGWTTRIWGSKQGIQTNDIGVADRAVMLARTTTGAEVRELPAPLETGPGLALPEKPSVLDTIKDPGILAAGAGLVTSVAGAIADQPVLQIAMVAAIAFFIYRFVIVKQKVDPA